MKKSLLFSGIIRHRRFSPKAHEFSYSTFMTYLNIEKQKQTFQNLTFCSLERFNWQSFRRKDHFGNPSESLDKSLRAFILKETGSPAEGELYLLTQLACFGFCFNPISIFIVFHKDSDEIAMLILEVTNTPWGERHCYLLDKPIEGSGNKQSFSFEKKLHVSPFMKMDYSYRLHFKYDANKIILHMENIKDKVKHFDATMILHSEELNNKNLLKMLLKHPFMQYKVIFSIYWQALKLFLKRIPLQTHPKKSRS